MFIIPEFSGPTIKEATSINILLDLINNRLAALGQMSWENIAFGTQGDCNYKETFDDLLEYRDILIQKINGCGCYKAYSLQQITSKIKTLTN